MKKWNVGKMGAKTQYSNIPTFQYIRIPASDGYILFSKTEYEQLRAENERFCTENEKLSMAL
ncbi:MAG: hypothetical protein A3H98_04230 [Bacteroidetes bacterium RIFCSPLOWO2_02_FULL_36_8]|nr:MAG: hypothetical protein A3H98_04230 [Bacteroidetes bacterium RIFCSPLOWO2_02_FULL_36_8]OFY70780.1 MAG: hypothetical protein A3G23_14735 [Bacteroidetes bacterium RIFCSPLOWO2_12_FULL_37_12]